MDEKIKRFLPEIVDGKLIVTIGFRDDAGRQEIAPDHEDFDAIANQICQIASKLRDPGCSRIGGSCFENFTSNQDCGQGTTVGCPFRVF